MEKNSNLKKDMGIILATALVTGNMMGSGIFMLPATLAKISGPGATIIAWLITGIGSIFLALSFGNLGTKFPSTGGPYEYNKRAFGKYTGFTSAWLYWNGSWIGNAAVVVAIGSYAGTLIPAISNNHLIGFLFTSAILWIFTLVNIFGVKVASKVQTIITIFELVLFITFIFVAATHFNLNNIGPLFPKGKGISTVPAASAFTLWAFIGLESASVAAGEIKNPEVNVKRSTIFGILIAVIMYICINFFAMGAMSQGRLAASQAPIGDIFSAILGSRIGKLITLGAVISVLGTTVGWLLSTARMAYAAGVDGVFPKVFSKLHPKFKTPYVALIIGSALANILLLFNYAKGFSAAFTFIVLLATLSYLPIYAMTAASEILLLFKKGSNFNIGKFITKSIIPLLGFSYAVWAIYGSGAETVMYGFTMMLLGVPFYIYMEIKNKSLSDKTVETRKVA